MLPPRALSRCPRARRVHGMSEPAADQLERIPPWRGSGDLVHCGPGAGDSGCGFGGAASRCPGGLGGVRAGSGGRSGAEEAGGLAARAAAPIHQVAALLRGEGQMWAAQSDEALLAQGRASAQGAPPSRSSACRCWRVCRRRSRWARECSTSAPGVAAMAVAFAELFPRLTVVGIDVMPRVSARATDRGREFGQRPDSSLREQDVSSLDEPDDIRRSVVAGPVHPCHRRLALVSCASSRPCGRAAG